MAVDGTTANGNTAQDGVAQAGNSKLPAARGLVVAVVQGDKSTGVREGDRGKKKGANRSKVGLLLFWG